MGNAHRYCVQRTHTMLEKQEERNEHVDFIRRQSFERRSRRKSFHVCSTVQCEWPPRSLKSIFIPKRWSTRYLVALALLFSSRAYPSFCRLPFPPLTAPTTVTFTAQIYLCLRATHASVWKFASRFVTCNSKRVILENLQLPDIPKFLSVDIP